MAEKEKPKNSGFSLKNIINTFRASTKLSTETLYGTSEKSHDDTAADLTDIRNISNSISNKYKKNVGEDILEFYSAVEANKLSKTNRALSAYNKKKNELTNFSGMLQNPDSFNINEIFSQESGRFQMYNSYKLIYENIPQMTQALSTYVDNILSPDDFSKAVFNVYINDTISTAFNNKDDFADVVDNCNYLMDHYNLESFAKKIITESLKIGDQFVAVLNIGEEMDKLVLSEDGVMTKEDVNKNLSSDDIELNENELNQLSEMLLSKKLVRPIKPVNESNGFFTESYKVKLAKYNEAQQNYANTVTLLKESIADIINHNIIIENSKKCLLEDNFELAREYKVTHSDTQFNSKMYGKKPDVDLNLAKDQKRKTSKNERVTVAGNVLKVLKPERVVKLVLDEFEYGYYYIENLENSPDYLTTGTYSINSNIFNNFKAQEFDQPDMVNAKYRLITDIFVRNLSKKINKKFINNRPEFKETIYNLLKQNYILNKQVRLLYLAPSEVIHFGVGNDEYKDSIYKSILFSAKLYLAVLTSQVMLRLVRAPEKRVYYVECSLDNDTEQVVQSAIRDVKTKDIKMSNFGQDINTLLQNIGTFQDYFIPVVNGNKPLEIDTLSGMNVEITNDFLEYLLKTMISGMGIPPEYLSYSENTEFARSLGMMNGKFVRSIIVYQKVYGEQFTKMFRMMYKNEFLNEFTLQDKAKANKKYLSRMAEIEAKKNQTVLADTPEEHTKISNDEVLAKTKLFDLELITIQFPSPQSLNMTTMQEQINGSKEIIEFISSTLVGEEDQKLGTKFKSLLLQDTLTNFDWTKYKKILEKAKVEVAEEALAGDNNGGGGY